MEHIGQKVRLPPVAGDPRKCTRTASGFFPEIKNVLKPDSPDIITQESYTQKITPGVRDKSRKLAVKQL